MAPTDIAIRRAAIISLELVRFTSRLLGSFALPLHFVLWQRLSGFVGLARGSICHEAG